MAYVFKSCLLAYSFLSDLNPFTMPRDRDAFEDLLDPSLSSSIGFFVASFFRFSAPERNRLSFLRQRFLVTLIGINKAGFIYQHESFAVWVYDVVKDKKHTFIIERTPSEQSRSVIFSSFSGSPDSQSVLDSIKRAIEALRSGGSLESSVTELPDDSDSNSESIPLLPLTNPSLESSVPTPPTTSQTDVRLPLVDVITSSLARAGGALNAGSQSSSSANFAQDKISWAATLDPKQCIKRFEPQGLSLFDLVVLADVVHEQAPIYCLFQRHCYWFANVIFMAIVMLYTLPPSASTVLPASTPASSIRAPAIAVPAPTPAVDTPKDANLLILPENPQAGRAGRWFGLLINDPGVLHTVVTIVTKKFATRLRAYIVEVILHD